MRSLESHGFVLFRLLGKPGRAQFLYLSPAAENLVGIPRHALVSRPRLVLRRIDPGDRGRLLDALRRGGGALSVGLSSPCVPRSLQLTIQTRAAPSGGWECLGFALPDRDRPPEREDSGLRMMVSGLIHDLGNLFVPIIGNAELAARAVPSEGPAQGNLRKVVLAANKAVAYMEAFEHRLERDGAAPDSLGPEALGRVVRGIREILPPGVDLEVCVDADARHLEGVGCDVRELDRVLLNLCLNAAQAMGGRGRIRVGLAWVESLPAVLVLDFTRPGCRGFARLTVEDDGPGLPAGSLARLFQPFVSERAGGKGLGLDVVRRFVTAAGGAVAVRSAPGSGARFDLFLPAQRRPRVPPAEGQGVVMVVDDNRPVLDATTQVLEAEGWRVLPFSQGEDAAAFFQEEGGPLVRLLITDVDLGWVDGLDVARAARHRHPGLPVIVMTGDPEDPRCRRLLQEVPGALLLRKPWQRAELVGLVRRLAAGSPEACR